ncbi:MAG: hypothetical protein GYB68_19250, partial [Chloroflexi bacterium]|nr:hypothetical protein [Chloroflexota bacterium]
MLRRRRRWAEEDDDGSPVSPLHHVIPVNLQRDIPLPKAIPGPLLIDVNALNRPVSSGLGPIFHCTLPHPDSYRIVLPGYPRHNFRPAAPLISEEDRVAFPVARPPTFRLLAGTP